MNRSVQSHRSTVHSKPWIARRIGLGLLVLMTAPLASAATVEFAGLIPGAGIVRKNVVSVQERKFEHMVRQQKDYSCGAAALATILRYGFAIEVGEPTVLEGLLASSDAELVKKRGFSLLDMQNYLHQFRLAGKGFRVQAPMLEKLKIPVIVLLDIGGYKHFVVLKQVADDQAYIADPSVGHRVMHKNAFVESWNGIVFAVIGPGFDDRTPLLDERRQVKAAELMRVIAADIEARVLDFGYIQSDLLKF